MRFSERYGHKPVRQIIQIESIDEELRNGLWNVLGTKVWIEFSGRDDYFQYRPEAGRFCAQLWDIYFKRPLDTLGIRWSDVAPAIRKYFFECEWYEVYDFVEFVAEHFPDPYYRDDFIRTCNCILERELSAFRFVGRTISPITTQEELAEIDCAVRNAQGPVRTHLQRALELLSDRKSPDYRNSIKESISAIESLVAITVGEKGTLGQLIKKLEDEIGLHPALKSAFSSLYGYTSDESGIRHAILESKNIGFEDAKFFLVVCSAFANFVKAKVAASDKMP